MKLFKRLASLNSLSPMIAPFLSYCSWTGGPADRRCDPEMDRDGPPGFHSRARGDSDRAWPQIIPQSLGMIGVFAERANWSRSKNGLTKCR